MGTRKQWSLAVQGALVLQAGHTCLTWEMPVPKSDYWLGVSPRIGGGELCVCASGEQSTSLTLDVAQGRGAH